MALIRWIILGAGSFASIQISRWTDSTTVLRYIRNDQARYQTFVVNRVSMIRDGSDQNEWRYVISEWNPADNASHSKQSKRWRTGPDFLLKEECFRPAEPAHMSNSVEGLEVRREIGSKKAQVCKTISSGVGSDHRHMGLHKIIHRYSKWIRLLRAVGWFILFGRYLMYKHRQQLSEINMQLSTQVMSLAETVVVQVAQRMDYEVEIASLDKGNTIRVSSSLRRLKPILRNGLLCIGGRLSLANIAPSERHPIILPYNGHLTDMVIQYYHEHSNHMGIMHVLGLMREKFWVIKGNAVVRRVLGKCVKCRKVHGKVIEQQMADLPPNHVEAGKLPFYRTRVLDSSYEFLGDNKLRNELLQGGVEFIFNPPGASHFGGAWEQLIGIVGRVLHVVLGTQQLDYEGLCTLFCEVEATVNSRPLTIVTSDSRDPAPLTPNKLLNMGDSPPGRDIATGGYSRQRWKQVQYMAEQFWARWKREYLLGLQQ
ncbi:uncharacterized protein [Macrobrachium rosenbergii]|uniref:uncharacterized protein n=1 Tax=Macrobrachium rosenbergii TaxID=79674 RepID=UPI0034D45B29